MGFLNGVAARAAAVKAKADYDAAQKAEYSPGIKKNLLGQPIVAKPTAAEYAKLQNPNPTGFSDINAGLQKQAVLGNVSADSPESPRSKAAKLMKRQAGIGQLKTMHVEEPEL